MKAVIFFSLTFGGYSRFDIIVLREGVGLGACTS